MTFGNSHKKITTFHTKLIIKLIWGVEKTEELGIWHLNT